MLYDGLQQAQATGVQPWYPEARSTWPQAVQGQSVAAYLCPSDGRGGRTKALTVGVAGADPAGIQLFLTNYLGIFDGLYDEDTWAGTVSNQRTAFGFNRNTTIAQIATARATRSWWPNT